MPADPVPGTEEQEEPDPSLDPGVADDTNASPEPPPAGGEAEPEGEVTADSILTDEEFDALKDDPVKLRQALQTSYTQKTQRVAGLQKFADAFERDPQGAIRKLAAGVGIQLPDAGAGPSTPKGREEAAASIRDEFAAVLGEETADKLMPIFEKMVDQRVAPLRLSTQTLAGQAALSQAESVLESFEAKHPEWKKLEPEMVKWSQKVQPTAGGDPLEYMEVLHQLATNATSNADKTRTLIDRVTASVRGSDSRKTGTPGSRVGDSGPVKPTFDQAWSAGVRGKRFER